ncbi:MAG: SGNH/GDSL hydrolase family protein [FCB group bacterium]|jgi:lysophospholipase L1-like esterase|nr:SGNH/GDSL hydrolase family protein [FCB group bacterium]
MNAGRLIAILAVLGTMHAVAAPPQGALDPAKGEPSPDGAIVWYDALELGLEGQGWSTGLKNPYDRLPAEAEGIVPPHVWGLSQQSAGLCVHFQTDSPSVSARWSLRSDSLAMPHMPATGVSGLDLYVRHEGRWIWVANGRPAQTKDNEMSLKDAPEGLHEYLLYLPLYNGTESLRIGVAAGKTLAKASRPAERVKPVLVWGSSITQGGCASRPGMAYPAILGRRLDRPFINLGFSGNGKMDPEVTRFIEKLDVAAYVIDCAPNMTPESITERAEPLVRSLRAAHPDTPIVVVENVPYQQSFYLQGSRDGYTAKNAVLRAAYDRLVADGVKGLFYIPSTELLGHDSESTVDGTHPNDLGFQRMADAMEQTLRQALGQ